MAVVVVGAAAGAAGFFLAPRPAAPTLTVIGPWAGTEEAAFRPVLEAFTDTYGIEVQYQIQRQEDLQTILPGDFAAGTAPGDVIFMVSSFIADPGNQQHIHPVTNFIDADSFVAGALDPVSSDDEIMGGVYTGKIKPGFWYRQSFFEANNLDVPDTWDEFVALLETISNIDGVSSPIVSGDGVGWPLSDVTEHFIATYGGAEMHRALMNGEKSWTDADVRAIFADRIVPLLAAGYFSEPLAWDTTALNAWWDGDHALYFMGSWITGMVEDSSDLGVFSLPPPEGVERGMVFAGDYLFIPRYTDNPGAAILLFQWLTSVQGQTIQVQQGGHVATVEGVPLSAYPTVDRGVAELLVGVDILSDLDDVIGGEFQSNFWSQLQGLWTSNDPAGDLTTILEGIQAEAP